MAWRAILALTDTGSAPTGRWRQPTGRISFTLAPSSLTAGTDYTIDHIAANVIDVTMMGAAGAGVPSFQLLGARLQNFRTIEAWTSEDVTEENETRFSRYLYHYREFQYGGYNSIALTDAQVLADWVVQYYRKGIKTMTLELFCSNHVQEALRLEPDRTPVHVAHGYGDGAPEQWIVRSRKRIYKDGHMWVEVTLDEDVMHSLGLDHAPFCAAYTAPDREQGLTAGRLNVDAVGVLLYEDGVGDPLFEVPLTIPEAGLVSNSPDLAATVLPIAHTTTMPDTVKTWPSGADLWQIDSGEALAAHYDFTRLEGLEGHHFWRSGLKANGMSLWLLNKKGTGELLGHAEPEPAGRQPSAGRCGACPPCTISCGCVTRRWGQRRTWCTRSPLRAPRWLTTPTTG